MLISKAIETCRRRFRQVGAIFGWMGVPMILMFFLSAAWTGMLAAIQLVPTAVANYLMGTSAFDNGEFWLLSRADDVIAIPATLLLALFAVAYLWLAGLVLFPEMESAQTRSWGMFHWPTRHAVSVFPNVQSVSNGRVQRDEARATDTPTRRSYWYWIVKVTRGVWVMLQPGSDNPVILLPKQILQTLTLFKYLGDGFPRFLIYSYAVLLTVNWFIASYRSFTQRADPRFVLRRLFYTFDLFFAVFAPMQTLIYAYYHFQFDRGEFSTRTETLPAGSYDRTARLFADPTQVSLFRIAFQYMQLTDSFRLFIRAALNIFTLNKWHETILKLIELDRMATQSKCTNGSRRTSRKTTQDTLSPPRLFCGHMLRILAATGFFCGGVGFLVYSVACVISSQRVCSTYTHCAVLSYRWNVGESACSCIVFVDRDTKVSTYTEWLDPVDTTDNLAALAMTGDLRIVQIVNKQLPSLPDELRNCRGLEQLILIHTKTRTFPDWAKTLIRLEYIHIEGDFTPNQLTYLPSDLFIGMTHLKFLHLGCLTQLPALPFFGHLPRLQYLVLALLHSVEEIPSLDHLPSLRQLNIIDAARVVSLPNVSHLSKLTMFFLLPQTPVCCNGFMTGVCNLADPSCRSCSNARAIECTSERITSEDLSKLKSTQGVLCNPGGSFDPQANSPSILNTDVACGGVMYKQCDVNGTAGICFPLRMQTISCVPDSNFIQMRRLQIQRRVGDVCDPTTEKWLGCETTDAS